MDTDVRRSIAINHGIPLTPNPLIDEEAFPTGANPNVNCTRLAANDTEQTIEPELDGSFCGEP